MDKHYFLHNHPGMEKKLGLDKNHVIVDKQDWINAKAIINPSTLSTNSVNESKGIAITLAYTPDPNPQKYLIDKVDNVKIDLCQNQNPEHIDDVPCTCPNCSPPYQIT